VERSPFPRRHGKTGAGKKAARGRAGLRKDSMNVNGAESAATDQDFGVTPAYFFLNFSTRPAVSIIFCFPVIKG